MKAKVFTGLLCLSKIDMERIQTSEEPGNQWMKVGVILMDKPDKFGSSILIQQRGSKKLKEDHIIIGNAVDKGVIDFELPHPIPSKMDTRCEQDETYRNY